MPYTSDAMWLKNLAAAIQAAYKKEHGGNGIHKENSDKFATRINAEFEFGISADEKFTNMAKEFVKELKTQIKEYTSGTIGRLTGRTSDDFIKHINENPGKDHYARLLFLAVKDIQDNYPTSTIQLPGLDKINVSKELNEKYILPISPAEDAKEIAISMTKNTPTS